MPFSQLVSCHNTWSEHMAEHKANAKQRKTAARKARHAAKSSSSGVRSSSDSGSESDTEHFSAIYAAETFMKVSAILCSDEKHKNGKHK